ncbi:hypothetical protein BY996DRAFT_6485795 [Phakopsora pachyrhizi]|nr:hypothetical protein BY996DRAFT_6485795 [Phakopsora pachyrhizi]
MSCKLGKATKAPFDLWQGEHTIVTEDKPKAEVNNFKDDYNNETDEDGEPVQIPIVKPLCAVAHIDLNNTEDHLQAVLVEEPTPVGGTAADNHSHTRSQTAIPLPLLGPVTQPVGAQQQHHGVEPKLTTSYEKK